MDNLTAELDELVIEQVDDLLRIGVAAAEAGWSPDSRWLAFTATSGELRGNEGLWLFSPKQKRVQLISEGNFGNFSWSPDGQKIVAVRCLDSFCYETKALFYDVQSLVE